MSDFYWRTGLTLMSANLRRPSPLKPIGSDVLRGNCHRPLSPRCGDRLLFQIDLPSSSALSNGSSSTAPLILTQTTRPSWSAMRAALRSDVTAARADPRFATALTPSCQPALKVDTLDYTKNGVPGAAQAICSSSKPDHRLPAAWQEAVLAHLAVWQPPSCAPARADSSMPGSRNSLHRSCKGASYRTSLPPLDRFHRRSPHRER